MKSPIYWHPAIYRLVMRMLYRKEYRTRYMLLAREIGDLNVLDVCCGDCELARYLPKGRYRGVDINSSFVRSAKKKGLDVRQLDVRTDPLPHTECVLMQSSLYQFIPEHEAVIAKLLSAATKKVIIAENVVNLADAPNPVLRFIARRLANPGTGHPTHRFNKETMATLLRNHHAARIIPAGRDIIGVIEK